jgi:23S rRNA (cytosine1962-C5)-methyltransferase
MSLTCRRRLALARASRPPTSDLRPLTSDFLILTSALRPLPSFFLLAPLGNGNKLLFNVDLIVFEDEHLLVANKPAGWSTHSPAPFAGEGLYEWLKHREPRWSNLAILHRLDKETSGLIVFGKTTAANRSLTDQFEKRLVHKKYILLTDRPAPSTPQRVKSALVRAGERYLSRPLHAGGEVAETCFGAGQKSCATGKGNDVFAIEAEPLTGKTHQIRVHAAASHFPILGDTLYGGTAANRVYLHAGGISFIHPATREPVSFTAPANFSDNPRHALRAALIDPSQTNACRLIHGAADGWPGLYIERLGDFLLAQSDAPLTAAQRECLEDCARRSSAQGLYHKILQRQARAAPQWLRGRTAPAEILVRENGLQFALRFDEGYSVGLFLDQRDNRRRFLTRYIAPKLALASAPEVLNAFAYTCGFSVAAAVSGARVTSLDLSKKYLDWGKRNFVLNRLDPARHDFIFGDAFAWFHRLAKKQRLFDVIILDPPTFSRSKERGVFQVEKDFGALLAAALPLLKPGGLMLASSNAATLAPEKFLDAIDRSLAQSRRRVVARQYIPQPPDFPVHRAEPAHLKTIWLQID